MRADILLREYPALFNRLEAERERVVESYHASGENYCGGRGYDISDPTAATAVRLCLLGDWVSAMQLTEQWINEKLPSKDRSILLDAWRGKDDHSKEAVQWTLMIEDLTNYLRRCAGHASDEPGAVCANGRKEKKRVYKR